MTSIQGTAEGIPPGVGLLDRERIIARPGFNRWLVPPAALAILPTCSARSSWAPSTAGC